MSARRVHILSPLRKTRTCREFAIGKAAGRTVAGLIGLVSGLGLTAALVLAAAVGYATRFDRSTPVLWASYGLWIVLVALCFVLGARLKTRSVFASALLAGACVGTALWLVTTWLLDNTLGFGA